MMTMKYEPPSLPSAKQTGVCTEYYLDWIQYCNRRHKPHLDSAQFDLQWYESRKKLVEAIAVIQEAAGFPNGIFNCPVEDVR
jgi:hypothetical protein